MDAPSPPAASAPPDINNVFLSGYGDLQPTLQGPSGLTLARHASAVPTQLKMENPADCFTAVVLQRTARVETWRNGRFTHRGVVPSATVNFSEPGLRIETVIHTANEVLIFLLPVSLIRAVSEHAGVRLPSDAGLGFPDPVGKIDTQVHALAREAQREIEAPGPFSRLRADLIGQELVIRMLQGHSSLAGAFNGNYRPLGGLSGRQLRRACELMDDSLENNLTLGLLAAAVDCSPTHFSRAFKQSTGMPPFAWLLHRRVDRAKALLLNPALSIAEVALMVGFSAQPQFTTAFKRVCGTTPAAWRRARPN